jgi:hypothetical protein
MGGTHRSEEFNRNILPISLPLVQAIGHRIAYEAALEAGIDPRLLALYESGVMLEDSAWYAEQGNISRAAQREREAKAADSLLAEMESLIRAMGVEKYSSAPMSSEEHWNDFASGLESFDGQASLDMIDPVSS